VKLVNRWWVATLLAASAACGTVGDKTVVISSGGDGDVLIPQLADQTQARVYNELLFDKLADIGLAQNTLGDAGYEPRIASSWTWSRDSLSIAFHLDRRVRWHDGRPVTAGDVRFAFAVLADPKTASSAGAELARVVDSVSVGDSLTATVWYKARTPEQFHAVAYNLFPLPEHLLAHVPHDSLKTSAFAKAPVGNGPFRFVSWEQKRRFEVVAFDGYMLGRPKIDRIVFAISTSAPTAVRAVLAGDADFIEQVTLEDVAEAARLPDVKIVPARRYEYGFLSFNLHTRDGKRPNPVFANAGVRRALTMAVDRAALVRNVHDSLGRPGLGPFSRSQWSADTTLRQITYDTAAAARLLDSLGWRRRPDGTRANGGQALAFSLVVSSSSRPRMRYAELLQQAFAKVGAKVEVDAVDMQAFVERITTHKFDAVLFAWTATPSPTGARQTWGSQAFKPGSPYNAGGWTNAVFDAQIDSALASMDVAAARAHFRVAYQAAVDDAPAIWLYEPMVVAGASRRLLTGPIRPDAWWASIRSWDVTGPPRRSAASSAKKP
jgi:peptide/nickel transport system substrate-binding protein